MQIIQKIKIIQSRYLILGKTLSFHFVFRKKNSIKFDRLLFNAKEKKIPSSTSQA